MPKDATARSHRPPPTTRQRQKRFSSLVMVRTHGSTRTAPRRPNDTDKSCTPLDSLFCSFITIMYTKKDLYLQLGSHVLEFAILRHDLHDHVNLDDSNVGGPVQLGPYLLHARVQDCRVRAPAGTHLKVHEIETRTGQRIGQENGVSNSQAAQQLPFQPERVSFVNNQLRYPAAPSQPYPTTYKNTSRVPRSQHNRDISPVRQHRSRVFRAHRRLLSVTPKNKTLTTNQKNKQT